MILALIALAILMGAFLGRLSAKKAPSSKCRDCPAGIAAEKYVQLHNKVSKDIESKLANIDDNEGSA